MITNNLLFLLAILLSLFTYQSFSTHMFGTPHVVSGEVFDDWNADGVRSALEPGIPSVLVTLWYLPSGVYSVLEDQSKYLKVSSYNTRFGSHLDSGKFQFTCLAYGTYKVSVEIPGTRPGTFSPANVGDDETVDSDIVSIDSKKIGWSEAFLAEEAGSTKLGVGLVQEIFAVAFSMTGDQTRPHPAPITTTGACYAALNKSNSQLYFRIVRGEWNDKSVEEPGGFYQGWDDEPEGYQVRTLNDVSNNKENVWFIPRESFVHDMIIGRMLVELRASGSFSDLSRLRGQFSRFRRSSLKETMIQLSGAYVYPEAVATTESGSAMIILDLERKRIEYEIWISSLYDDEESHTTLNGPAKVNEEGEVLFEFEKGPYKSGVIDGLTEEFMVQLLRGETYLNVGSMNYPQGLLRGQIRGWQQVQYQSISKLLPSQDVPKKPFGDAVIQIDLRKKTLTYYIFFGQLSQHETSATLGPFVLYGDVLKPYRDGVKQGFMYLSDEEINMALSGAYTIEIRTPGGIELSSKVTNWS